MRAFLIVHGFVQGVGYRNFVRRAAKRHGVCGMVRNRLDGSVEILADADSQKLENFEKEINVSMKNGPQVMHIEHLDENATELSNVNVEGFKIWPTL
ncbi:MAG: acylphosphatase [Candidatus Marsarchaeota archaeon]|nr:acylphosphatase [Candidatus Marsarchaeota archaeon]